MVVKRNKESILITYATKGGATAAVAERIGDALDAEGFTADVMPVDRVVDLRPYPAIVLGSAVYAGQWRKEAIAFLETYESELAKRAVWLFSSASTNQRDPLGLAKGWRFPAAQQPIADRIQVRDIAFLRGVTDPKQVNFLERLAIKKGEKPVDDFRGWDSISSWTRLIAETLRQARIEILPKGQ